MKSTVVFKVFLCLMCLLFTTGSQAQSARVGYESEEGLGMAVLAQLEQDEGRQDPYQTNQDYPSPDSGQVEDDQVMPDPNSQDEDVQEQTEGDYPSREYDQPDEDHPAMEPNEIPDDDSDKDYPSPAYGDVDEEHPSDVQPTGSGANRTAVGSAPGAISQQAAPPKCKGASGHSIFRLTSAGIDSGASYFQPGARVEFWNDSNVKQEVVVEPSGILSDSSFSITPGSKVLMFASSPGEVTGGSIVANPGGGQTVHDIVVCP